MNRTETNRSELSEFNRNRTPQVFFVTELVRGGDLLAYVRRRRWLPAPAARGIFGQLLEAVDYLHRSGIYHRDLKCENVLLDDEGPADSAAAAAPRVRLTDFGFAREWFEAHRLCRTYCGSAAYASPEILQGLPYEPSTADVWSLGVVLFIMVRSLGPAGPARWFAPPKM